MSTEAVSTEPTSQEPVSQPLSLDQISGEDAVKIVQQAKELNVSVEDILSGKVKAPTGAPADLQPEQSNKEMVADAAKEAMRKFKVRSNGEDLEVDEEELIRGYGHQKAANKILQEGKAAKKQAAEMIEMLRDPSRLWEVAQKLGHDPRAIAERLLAQQLEEETLDPKDREARETRRKLEAYEQREKEAREKEERRLMEEAKARYIQDFEQQFTKALTETGLPATKQTFADMAKYVAKAAKLGVKMTAQEAAILVREDIQKAQTSILKSADGETLLKLLGDEMAEKILKARGARVKQPIVSRPAEQGERIDLEASSGKKRMTAREWQDFKRGTK